LADDRFRVSLPAVTKEEELSVRLMHTDGFTREATVRLQPGGGRTVPVVTEMRVKAGHDVKIPVRFMVGDTVLCGADIPDGAAFYGLMSWASFSDPDGDRIATATVTLGVGRHVIHMQAYGCTEAEITVIVEP
jgi:hypothetical protein